jgi:hypothetical protein
MEIVLNILNRYTLAGIFIFVLELAMLFFDDSKRPLPHIISELAITRGVSKAEAEKRSVMLNVAYAILFWPVGFLHHIKSIFKQ